MYNIQQMNFYGFLPIFHTVDIFYRYFERYRVALGSGHSDARPIYPTELVTAKCCPNRKCYLSEERGDDPPRFEEGIIKAMDTYEVILLQTDECHRREDNLIYYKYKPALVKISHSCHCVHPSPSPTEDGFIWNMTPPQTDECNNDVQL